MTYLELLSKGWNIIPGEIHHLERGIELLSTTAFQVPYIVFTSNLTFLHENKQKNVYNNSINPTSIFAIYAQEVYVTLSI